MPETTSVVKPLTLRHWGARAAVIWPVDGLWRLGRMRTETAKFVTASPNYQNPTMLH
jgi:hypothetical protein